MKVLRRILTLAILVSTVLGSYGYVGTAYASARTANWLVSITYQNVGDAATTISVDFYNEGNATALNYNPLTGIGDGTLAKGAATSLYIGNVSGLTTNGFRGSAVMLSTQPLVATVVQFSNDAGFKMRLLTNGFQTTDAASQYIIPTTLLNTFLRTTVFSIQNTESSAIDAVVRFYDANNNGVLASTITHTIPALSNKYIDMDQVADTGFSGSVTSFNGSAIITAYLQGTTTPAKIVSAINEYYTDRNVASSFEGVPLASAANTINMATGVCRKFGLDSFYAVTNASLTDSATITVTYRNVDGTLKAKDGNYNIGPGQKRSIITCSPNDSTNMTDFTGSAVIESVGAPIAVIGRAQASIGSSDPNYADVFTAFMGEAVGTSKRALPFVRWASDSRFAASTGGYQRSYLAIQSLTAGDNLFDVRYYDKSGNVCATEQLTIAQYAKGSSNPSTAGALGKCGMNAGEFGYYPDGTFGGAVVIQANSANPSATFIAIARVQNPGAGEDYNAVAIP